MKTLIILCCTAVFLSGCVVSPLYGDGRGRDGGHEHHDRDEYRDYGNHDRDPGDHHGDRN